jgi:uncharacterized protein (TIGR03000 family)
MVGERLTSVTIGRSIRMRKLLTVAALTAALSLLVVADATAGGRRGGGGCPGGSCGGGGYASGGCYGGSCGGGGYAMGGHHGGTVVAGAPMGYSGGIYQVPTSGTTHHAALNQPAQMLVALPADASLTIDGYVTKSTSSQRLFTTPALEVGKSFTYTLKATVQRDGKPETVTRVVTVRGGEQSHVDLDFNAPVAADE